MAAVVSSSSMVSVKRSAFTAGRVSLRAKAAAPVAFKPRGMTVMAFKVTLETPEGAQAIECADDTYILDAAEVRIRASPRACCFNITPDRLMSSRSFVSRHARLVIGGR